MSVSQKNIDSVNAVLTVKIGKEDYQEKVEKALKDIRKKANVPGFRPGNVPAGMVKKMYGKSVLAEQVNKLISESLYNYIRENNLSILGEPIPSEEGADEMIDFDKDEEFEFSFDIGLAPEVKTTLTAKDKFKYHEIAVTDEMIDKQVNAYTSQTGKNTIIDGPSIESDMVRGNLTELKEGGLTLENVIIMPKYMSDETEKAKFDALKKDQEVTFNVAKAYNGNEQEIRYLLHLEKDADVSGYTSEFTFKVTEISRFEPGELNQELFDTVLGKDTVKTEEEFKAKIKESLAKQTAPESDYKFLVDVRQKLLDKNSKITFPDEFLKRFMLATNEKTTAEKIEEEYPKTIEGLTWHLIKEKLVKDNKLEIQPEEVQAFAKKVAQSQFAQYGMMNTPDEMLENYAQSMLKDKQTMNNIVDRALEEKLIVLLKDKVTLENETVSMEEFNKFFDMPEDQSEK